MLRPANTHLTWLVWLAGSCGGLQVDTDSFAKQGTQAPAVQSNGGTPASFNCSPLDGTYTFSYRELDGGCGPWSDDLLQLDHGQVRSSAHGCSEGQVNMPDTCVLQIDSVCLAPLDLDVVTQHVTGSISEPQDNRYATGTVQVTFEYASGKVCVGHYLVTANRKS